MGEPDLNREANQVSAARQLCVVTLAFNAALGASLQALQARPRSPRVEVLTSLEVKALERSLERLERGLKRLERRPARPHQLTRLERDLATLERLAARYYQRSSPQEGRAEALKARALLLSALSEERALLTLHERRLCLRPAHSANLAGAHLALQQPKRALQHLSAGAACSPSPQSYWEASLIAAALARDELLVAHLKARLADQERMTKERVDE